jgi:hypothetical protein
MTRRSPLTPERVEEAQKDRGSRVPTKVGPGSFRLAIRLSAEMYQRLREEANARRMALADTVRRAHSWRLVSMPLWMPSMQRSRRRRCGAISPSSMA